MGFEGVDAVYPLSPLQEGLLFHALAAPDSGMYVNQCILTLRGELDTDAMIQAWARAAERHEVLRTFFVWEGLASPAQVVDRRVELRFQVHESETLSPPARRAQMDSILQNRRQTGFDPSVAPLSCVDLVRTGNRTHDLVWTFHHLLLDGWSMFIVLKDVFGAYEALARGAEAAIEAPRPYRDHIAWLRRQDVAGAKAFWQRTLKGFTAPTRVRGLAGQGAPPASLEAAARIEIRLGTDTTSALEALARRRRLTLNTLLQLAWATVLGRWSGRNDIVFGTIVSGRPVDLAGFESMVGLFTNTLPVRVALRADEPVIEALGQLQESLLEIRQYEYSRLVDIQAWSDLPAGEPLFESILLFENFRKEIPLDSMLETLSVDNVRWFEHTNFPIAVLAIPEERFLIRLLFHLDRIGPDTARRILDDLRSVLEAMAENVDRPLRELHRASGNHRHRIVVEWNDTGMELPGGSIQERFERQVEQSPQSLAVADDDERLTYRELDLRANRLARHLRGLGVTAESRVGLCLRRSVRIPEALLGILKAGGAYVPLDPDYPPERLAFMVRDSGIRFVLGEREALESLPRHGATIVDLDADRERIAVASDEPLAVRTTPYHLAYVIYTSGSTGRPKGVGVEHRSVVSLAFGADGYAQLGPGRTLLHFAPISFDASTFEIWGALLRGGTCVVAPAGPVSAERLGRTLRDHGVDTLWLTSSLFNAVLDEDPGVLAGVEQLLTGGEALSPAHVRRALEALPGARLVNGYGPTECTTFAVTYPIERPPDESGVPIGRPIRNATTYVLDRAGESVAAGETGELQIGGAGVARGYLGRPGLTAERFVPDAFAHRAGERLYRTGDLVRHLPDGRLEFLGRVDHQVKLRGFRIELGEIEARLLEHPRVRQGVVRLREDRGGQPRLVAYVVAENGTRPELDRLRAHLRRELPEYMVPSAFVSLDALPLSPNGKIHYEALPAPDREAHVTGDTFRAPRSEIEERLSRVWAELLGLERIGVDDKFFDLGANSLLMIRAHGELKKVVDIEVGIIELFEHPTVASLAQHIESKLGGERPAEPAPESVAPEEAMRVRSIRDRLLRRRQRTERGR